MKSKAKLFTIFILLVALLLVLVTLGTSLTRHTRALSLGPTLDKFVYLPFISKADNSPPPNISSIELVSVTENGGLNTIHALSDGLFISLDILFRRGNDG